MAPGRLSGRVPEVRRRRTFLSDVVDDVAQSHAVVHSRPETGRRPQRQWRAASRRDHPAILRRWRSRRGRRRRGRLLRAARRRADLSQRQLARRGRVPQSVVSRIESGRSASPGVETIARLLRAADHHLVAAPGSGLESSDGSDLPVRDRGGRRYPAHLDVRPVDRFGSWWGDWSMLSTRSPDIWDPAPRRRPFAPSISPDGAATNGGRRVTTLGADPWTPTRGAGR